LAAARDAPEEKLTANRDRRERAEKRSPKRASC
jgi:hypothetical protein